MLSGRGERPWWSRLHSRWPSHSVTAILPWTGMQSNVKGRLMSRARGAGANSPIPASIAPKKISGRSPPDVNWLWILTATPPGSGRIGPALRTACRDATCDHRSDCRRAPCRSPLPGRSRQLQRPVRRRSPVLLEADLRSPGEVVDRSEPEQLQEPGRGVVRHIPLFIPR